MLPRWLGSLLKWRNRNVQSARPRRTTKRRLALEPLEDRLAPAAAFSEFVDPHPAAGNQFGASVVALSTGNVVITSPFDDAGGTDAGAVYLFNGATGALISTLQGSNADDNVGDGGVTALSNGNFVVLSTKCDNGSVNNAGAATWGNGITGLNGVVSAANSLVGSSGSDFSLTPVAIGPRVQELSNGNYVVIVPLWDNGSIVDAGAVTWANGLSGISGPISAANSLVGSTSGDHVGDRLAALSNGNYVVQSSLWNNGAAADAGAVTWGNGSIGISGVVSAANSLVGNTPDDHVGSSDLTLLSNSNYVVQSSSWDNGAATDAGAVTWGNGSTGISGVVSAANSLVGNTSGDHVGSSDLTLLSNGNYVVRSLHWHNGAATDAGAVTWGNGSTGISGVVSTANSLVGSTSGDQVGSSDLTLLSNGNYVVRSSIWDNGAATNAGAVTWGNGSTGISGVVSAANSLVGSTANDQVGNLGVTALTNGNYVVQSSLWNNGAAADAGAVTWGNGSIGISGVVSAANSLVGSTPSDQVGTTGVTALSNGNYVVRSSGWNNGAANNAGTATWGNGTTGTIGVVSAANSLVGSTANDHVSFSGVTALNNGNYVVRSADWDSGGLANAGAATWGNGTTGTIGVVSAANSLVGSTANDNVSFSGVTALSNGNYVVSSEIWDSGGVANAGAATWGNGTTGTIGVVSAANSLVGSTANDNVGFSGVTALNNGNYVVRSGNWDSGGAANVGAVTWGSGTTGISGTVSAANSLVGSTANDRVGNFFVTALTNGNYIVGSLNWDNGAVVNAGAVTFGSGSSGISGTVSDTNSRLGEVANSSLQSIVVDNGNGTFFARFLDEGGGRVWVGSQIDGFSSSVNGRIWQDSNSNGVRDVNESDISAAVVELFGSTNAIIGDADDISLGTKITSNNGAYSFLSPPTYSNYYLAFRPPVDFAFTLQDQGTDDFLDSDVDPATGHTAMFTIGASEGVVRDAGLIGSAPLFGWAARAGDTGADVGNDIATDPAGNVYVTGSFSGTADFDHGPGVVSVTSAGSDDIFVAKYTPAGALIWAKSMGGGSSDVATGIALDASGNVYATGYFASTNADFDPSSATFPLTAAGNDIFVSKLDANGNFVSAIQMGGSGNDRGHAITLSGSNFYLTGIFSSTADFDPTPGGNSNLLSAGDTDILVAKYTTAGSLVWAKQLGGADRDEAYAIAVDGAGNVHTTGNFSDIADFDPSAGATFNLTVFDINDAFVSKLDSNGDFVWAKQFRGDSSGRGIAVDSDGNVFTTGHFGGTVDFDPDVALTLNLTSAGSDDVFVSKLDSGGSFAWAKRVGSGSSDRSAAIAVGVDGGVYTTGFFGGTVDFDPGVGTFNLTTAGDKDVFVLRLDSTGNFAWARQVGGAGADAATAFAIDASGTSYFTGYFNATADFDPSIGILNLTSTGGTDIFVAKLLPNAAPTAIALSSTSVAENQPSGVTVGTFSTTDPGDNHTYTLVAGAGSMDNASFTITGNSLQTLFSLNYELKSSYSIRVRSSDIFNQFIEQSFTISVGDVFEPATHFIFTTPSSTVAGSSFNVTVTALDASNDTVTAFTGTVHFTSSDPQAILPVDTTLSNGTSVLAVTLKTAASQTVGVQAGAISATNTLAVSHAATDHFTLAFVPNSILSGVPFAIQLTAVDAFNNTATGYTGLAHFSSSDGAAVLPANSSLTNGTGLFAVMLKTAGNQTLNATDTTTSSISAGASITVTTPPGVATHFTIAAGLVETSYSATAGNAFVLSVIARDASNNTVTGYNGTVHFSSSDIQAFLPFDTTLTSGVGYFAAILRTAGNQTITVAGSSAAGSITGTSNIVAVAVSSLHHFGLSTPATAITGTAFNFTVAAQDQFNNTIPTYNGTVHFTSSDPNSVLPVNSTLSSGIRVFSATLKTSGNQSITATDITTASIAGSSAAIVTRGLVINAATPTVNGFTATFNKPFEPGTTASPVINLYDSNSALGVADVLLARNAIQTITFGAIANNATFNLVFLGSTASGITYSTNTATLQTNIQNALNALSTVGSGNALVTALSTSSVTVQFQGTRSFQAQANMSASPAAITVATTTTGSANMASSTPRASLLINPGNQGMTFIMSGTGAAGVLAADTYQITIRSASTGFKDLLGAPLDGNNDGVTGDNFVTTFTVATTPSVILNIPDFARGPDSSYNVRIPNNAGEEVQTITFTGTANGSTFNLGFNGVTASGVTYSSNAATLQSNIQTALDGLATINNTRRAGTAVISTNATSATVRFQNVMGGFDQPLLTTSTGTLGITQTTAGVNTGIPVTLNGATGVTAVTFSLLYNPALFTVTGAYSIAGGSSFTLVGTPSGGVANFSFALGGAPALGATATLGHIVGFVPSSAQSSFKAMHLLQLSSIVATGAASTPVGNSAVQIVAFFGDANGDGTITGGDAALVSRVNSNVDTIGTSQVAGLAAYRMLDPFVMIDFNNTGPVDSGDVTLINSYLVRSQTQIPTPPPFSSLSLTAAGPDPTLSLPSDLRAAAGETVVVPVNIDITRPGDSPGMMEAILALRYDTSVFTVSAADIQLGSVPSAGNGWQLRSAVNSVTGDTDKSHVGSSAHDLAALWQAEGVQAQDWMSNDSLPSLGKSLRRGRQLLATAVQEAFEVGNSA